MTFRELQPGRNQHRRVAVIFDRVARKEVKVHQRGRSFFRWDAHDLRVENAALRRVAREALEGSVS